MADTDTVKGWLRAILRDAGGAVWTDGELENGIRQAWEDVLAASGKPWIFNGLDGQAGASTFPAGTLRVICRGGLAYCLLGRAAERSDAFQFDSQQTANALAAAGKVMERFEKSLAGLGMVRVKDLQTAADRPYPGEEDDSQPGWQLD